MTTQSCWSYKLQGDFAGKFYEYCRDMHIQFTHRPSANGYTLFKCIMTTEQASETNAFIWEHEKSRKNESIMPSLQDAIWKLNQTRSTAYIRVLYTFEDEIHSVISDVTEQIMRHYDDSTKATYETMFYFQECRIDKIMLDTLDLNTVLIYIKKR